MTDEFDPSHISGSTRTGRPSSYKIEYAKQAAKLCEMGATDIELADFFDVATSTIYEWRNRYAEFSEAVIAGKDAADARVERAFYNRAVGYTFESEKIFQHAGEIIRADIREHVPPDAGAALNWLKNRKPDKWRDKQDVEHSGKDGGAIEQKVTHIIDEATIDMAMSKLKSIG